MSALTIWIIAIVVILAIVLWYVASKKKGEKVSTSIPSEKPQDYQDKKEDSSNSQE